MGSFKRWTTCVASRVDRWVGMVEDHEGNVSGLLEELGARVARARAELARLSRESERMHKSMADAEREAAQWRERAARTEDNERALSCLGRARRLDERAETLRHSLANHQQTHAQLSDRMQELQQRFDEVRHKRSELRARQAHAEALELTSPGAPAGDLEDALDRWEQRVAGGEWRSDPPVEVDVLDREYREEEEREALERELAALRGRHD